MYSTTLLLFKAAEEFFLNKHERISLQDLVQFISKISEQIDIGSKSTYLTKIHEMTIDEIVVLFRPLKHWIKNQNIKFIIDELAPCKLIENFSANEHHLLLSLLRGNYLSEGASSQTVLFWSKVAEIRYDIRAIREFYLLSHKDSSLILNWHNILPTPEHVTEYVRASIIKELCPLVFQQTQSKSDLIYFLEVLAEYQLNHFIEVDQVLPLMRSDHLIIEAIKARSRANSKFPWFRVLFYSLAKHIQELEARAELIALEKSVVFENLLELVSVNLKTREDHRLSKDEMSLVALVLQLCFQSRAVDLNRVREVLILAAALYDGHLTLSPEFLKWLIEEQDAGKT